ncbi:unnamed protein product [Adineta steineri]|uniref:MD-2-related lipid-recognition domain-containing protein n=2 Tax=Adineta steineri TaxID=433720 RepID=A0A815FMX1_9BILA|nr:unnamed protein product [Adineta steineri]
MILINLILFLQLTLVISLISWENCNSKTNDIKLINLTVSPDPLIVPGLVSITITIYTHQNFTSPVKAVLSLEKKILIGYFPVPCFSIGSCTYEDLCTLCTKCNCSMGTGEHTFNLPITIDSSSWMLSGNYQAQIDLETSTKQKGCVKIYNIFLKTKK